MRIVAYDPSFINLGVAFGVSGKSGLDIYSADTYKIDRLLNKLGLKHDWDQSDNRRRLVMVSRVIGYTLQAFKPDTIVLEDPVYNKKNPDSLITQSRCLGTIETNIEQYLVSNPHVTVTNFKPNPIKYAVGVKSGELKDKTAITRCLQTLMKDGVLRYTDETMLPHLMDDHTNDAVAMVYTKHLEAQHELV